MRRLYYLTALFLQLVWRETADGQRMGIKHALDVAWAVHRRTKI